MIKKRIYFTPLLITVLIAASCSSGKKGGQSYVGRVYHNTTAHYNGYYYAKQKMTESEDQMRLAHKDDFEKLLPIYPYGNVTDPAAGGEMDSIVKRLTVVVKLHPESKWSDDCYFNIGKAYYYKKNYDAALATFQYVSSQFKGKASSPASSAPAKKKKKYHGKPMTKAEREKEEAKAEEKAENQKSSVFDFLQHKPVRNIDLLWMVRTYANLKRYSDAAAILDYIEQGKDFPKDLKGELALTKSYVYIEQSQYDHAIDPMKTAINLAGDKKDATRYTYILAQLYQLTGNYKSANQAFTQVTKMRPSYEMDFNARISVGKNYVKSGSGSAHEILTALDNMAHNDKYDQFYDQIYYYMALVNLRQNKDEDAVKNLETSIAESFTNPHQKGLSFLKLGEINFSEQDYFSAQPNYDSAVVFLNSKFDTLDRVKEINSILNRIVVELNIILVQDSLQKLAKMSEKERNKFLDNAIVQIERQKQLAAQDTMLDLQTQQVQDLPGNESSSGNWYFYNVSTKGSGYNEFVKKWGNRPEEDNWRRSNKKSNEGIAEETGAEEQSDHADNASASSSEDATRKAMLAAIPLTPEKMDASNKKMFSAYYTLGTIYKDDLKNLPKAIETFEKLASRFPDNENIPQVSYNLYLLYLEVGNTAKADAWKEKILQNYPSSAFALVISDPDYWAKNREKENALNNYYASTYDFFVGEQYTDVINRAKSADSLFKPNPLRPKFDLLEAFAIGKTQDRQAYVNALDTIVKKYPSGDEHDKAIEILTLLGEKVSAEVKPADLSKKDDKNAKPAPYQVHPNNPHYVAIVFNMVSPKTKPISDSLANYNTANYSLDNLKVSSQLLDTKTQMILIKQFKTKDMAMEYYYNVSDLDFMSEARDDIGYDIFVIDDKNFPIFYQRKNVAEYLNFFSANYEDSGDGE